MMYTICHYEDVHRKQLINGVMDDRIGELGIMKIGQRRNYPGGQVFMTVSEAERYLTALDIFEIRDSEATPSRKSDHFRIFGLEPRSLDLYWHRHAIRLKNDVPLQEVYQLGGLRHSFSTEAIYDDNYEDILETLIDLFPQEAIVQQNLNEWRFMFGLAPRNGPHSYRLIVESPPSKQFALAKLRLAA